MKLAKWMLVAALAAGTFAASIAEGENSYTVGGVGPEDGSLSKALTFDRSGKGNDDATTSVRIAKVWDDDSDRAGRRPSSVSFTLAGGSFATNVVLDCSGGADRVETTVSGVPRYEGGAEIAYTLVEDPVPGDYRAVVVDEGKVVPGNGSGPGVSLSLTVNGAQNARIGTDGSLAFLATLSGAEPDGSVEWSWDSGNGVRTVQSDVSEAGEATLALPFSDIASADPDRNYVMTAIYRTNGVEAARARVRFGILGDDPAVIFAEPGPDPTLFVDEPIAFRAVSFLGKASTELHLKWNCGSALSDGYSTPANDTTEATLAFREAGDHAVTVTVTDQDNRTGTETIVVHVVAPPEPIQSFSVTNSYASPPVVSNVVARQRWPWNGLVDVDYEVGGGAEGLEARIVFQEQGGAGRTWVATNFLAGAKPSAEPGFHRATWDTAADGATNVVAANVVATVCLEKSKYAELYLVTEDYKVSDDGTQILDHYEEPVDPANLPTRQTIEFGTEHTFKVIGAVPDAASPGSVLYSVVEDAEPVLATDADTIANAGFRVSVARTASAGDTATIQAVRHGVKSGAMTIAAVPYRSIFVCDGHMVLSDDGSKLYDPNWPDDPFTYADFLWGVNFSFGRFRGDDVPFLLIAVDTVQRKLVRIDVKDNPGDEDAKVLLSGANPECFTLNLAGSCVHIKADATDGAEVYVRARYRGLESAPQGFIITAF